MSVAVGDGRALQRLVPVHRLITITKQVSLWKAVLSDEVRRARCRRSWSESTGCLTVRCSSTGRPVFFDFSGGAGSGCWGRCGHLRGGLPLLLDTVASAMEFVRNGLCLNTSLDQPSLGSVGL